MSLSDIQISAFIFPGLKVIFKGFFLLGLSERCLTRLLSLIFFCIFYKENGLATLNHVEMVQVEHCED